MQQLTVKPETALVRPFIVAAVLRGVRLDAARYNSFIDLQDKLHQNLCRQRSLVAIGTHDLAKVKGPFTYEALAPRDISFVPLKQEREFKADELLDHYLENDQKLKRYVPLIRDSLVYPVVLDADRTVLSLPPIINGARSAISLDTRDVFIECTATDLTKAKVVLNTVACMFAEYCESPFEVEPVEVVDAFGESHVYPDLSPREMEVDAAHVNGVLGLDLAPADIARLLRSMQLECSGSGGGGGGKLSVRVPPTRSDVLHACDVVEDVAIAHGFNNVPQRIPSAYTAGKELPLNQLTELLRGEIAMAGYTEVLTWALCSRAEAFASMRREEPAGGGAVAVGNPATAEFEIVRPALLPSALKTLGANKSGELPIRLFEISDVVLLAPERAVGARNERRLVAVSCAVEAGFEVIHGLLNRVMDVLGVPCDGFETAVAPSAAAKVGSYCWRPSDDASFFPGRQATILYKGSPVGVFGVVHPDVLAEFDVTAPVSALELNLEPFCFDQHGRSMLRRADDDGEGGGGGDAEMAPCS